MPKPTNASGTQSFDRAGIAEDLFLQRGAGAAARRADWNTTLGDFDLAAAVIDRLKLAGGETLIDVGCGSGRQLRRLQDALMGGGTALGVDISPEAVAKASARGLRARVGDAADLPVPSHTADALTCLYAIYYHADLDAVITEFERVLRPAGRLVIAGPGASSNVELYGFHHRATGAEPTDADRMALGYVGFAVREVLERKGFRDVSLEEFRNRVEFPDVDSFLAYWESTSLFARTPAASVARGKEILSGVSAPVVVTKYVEVLAASAPEVPK